MYIYASELHIPTPLPSRGEAVSINMLAMSLLLNWERGGRGGGGWREEGRGGGVVKAYAIWHIQTCTYAYIYIMYI